MTQERLFLFSHVCWMTWSLLIMSSETVAADQCLRFDVPATSAAIEQEPRHPGQKTIEIVVPVSLNLVTDAKISIDTLLTKSGHEGSFSLSSMDNRE